MKRAQIQIGETVAVLVVFFILLGFGFGFYSKISQKKYMDKVAEFNELRAVETAQTVSFLPELECSDDSIVHTNCIDIYKLNASFNKNGNGVMQLNNEYYESLFGYSTIILEKKFSTPEMNLTLYDRPLDDYAELKNFFIPILIRDPRKGPNDKDEYYFGILNVDYYIK